MPRPEDSRVLDAAMARLAERGHPVNGNGKSAPNHHLDVSEPTFATLRDLLDVGSHVEPPTVAAYRFAYEARACVICSKDKLGKSTYAATAVACSSCGRPFLGQPTFPGRWLWVGLEEHQDDAVARFQELNANPDHIELAIAKPTTLIQEIRRRLSETTFIGVVVDSIAEFARVTTAGKPPSEGDSSGWSTVVRPLVEISHERGVAMTCLHHVRRDGEERGSSELFAAFDAVFVMAGPTKDEDPSTRHFSGRGRRGIDAKPFSVRWDGTDYHLVGGALSLDARILIHIEQGKGLSRNRIRQLVGGRGEDVDKAVDELLRRHAIRDDGNERGAKLVANRAQAGVA